MEWNKNGKTKIPLKTLHKILTILLGISLVLIVLILVGIRAPYVVGPLILLLVVYTILQKGWWRCPHCNKHLGKFGLPEICPHCGEELNIR